MGVSQAPQIQHPQNQIPQVPTPPPIICFSSISHRGAQNLHVTQPHGRFLSAPCPPCLGLSPQASAQAAPSARNILPPPLHLTTSTSRLRCRFTHHLFRRAFLIPYTTPGQAGCSFVGSCGTSNAPDRSPDCSLSRHLLNCPSSLPRPLATRRNST